MNPLKFARSLAGLESYLVWASYREHYADSAAPAVAASYRHLLDRLAEIDPGGKVTAAVAEAVSTYERECDRIGEAAEARREREAAEYEEAVRRRQSAIAVECPFCGAAPGLVCRTAGPSGMRHPKGVHDHAARYRVARGLLGQAEPGPGAP